MIAIAGALNRTVVRGAPGEPWLATSSSMPAIAKSAISASNPYLRASDQWLLTL
jgi:hypothetical protein